MREKRYEKQIDRNRQSKALSQLCKEHRLGFVELESLSKVDAVLFDEKTLGEVAFAEVKGVNESIGEKNYVRVSVRKLHHCQKQQIEEGRPVCIVWAFYDGIGYIWVKDIEGSVKWLGMKKIRPGSLWDRELMFYMNQDKLKFVLYEENNVNSDNTGESDIRTNR
jgi:hypothetical protein